ncbi:unnamed protein product [Symbiodinium natans]|uniref:Uncharacterized protein n=1 Tax=Symbiodinium natans TaxID=878477 RepID=A0A812PQ85_9DINO|nr:unnamed protein product [Symbiodinium natans]
MSILDRLVGEDGHAFAIAAKVCASVLADLRWGIGNPGADTGKFSGHIKHADFAEHLLRLSRKHDASLHAYIRDIKDPQVYVALKARITRAAQIGNCGECANLAACYLFLEPDVMPITLCEHPIVDGVHDDNHCYVTFALGSNPGKEYVLDVWAYLYMRHMNGPEHWKFGFHPKADHPKVAKELYSEWTPGAADPPKPLEKVVFSVEYLQRLQPETLQDALPQAIREQALNRLCKLTGPKEQEFEKALKELHDDIASQVDSAVININIPPPSEPLCSMRASSAKEQLGRMSDAHHADEVLGLSVRKASSDRMTDS